MTVLASLLAAAGTLAARASGSTLRAADQGMNVCYFTNWARYRGGLINTGKDIFEMGLDGDLCTHFMYGFAKVSPNGDIVPSDPNADYIQGSGNGLCKEECNG